MINRAVVIVKYKKPAVEWINEADPYVDDPGITLDNANNDRTVYLIMDQDAENPKALGRWIKKNYKILFENELEGWYTDENLWPQNRNFKLFNDWFTIECHTVVEDTVGAPIVDIDT